MQCHSTIVLSIRLFPSVGITFIAAGGNTLYRSNLQRLKLILHMCINKSEQILKSFSHTHTHTCLLSFSAYLLQVSYFLSELVFSPWRLLLCTRQAHLKITDLLHRKHNANNYTKYLDTQIGTGTKNFLSLLKCVNMYTAVPIPINFNKCTINIYSK